MKKLTLLFITLLLLIASCKPDNGIQLTDASSIIIGGPLGRALDSSTQGRMKWFMVDEKTEGVRIYHIDSAKISLSKGWKGEAVGKWMVAASHCVMRTHDETIKKHLLTIADFLISQQNAEGYIGTFNDTARFYGHPKKNDQNFDLWMVGYVMQGLMEVYKISLDEKYLIAARKIADLCIGTFQQGNKKIVNSGPFSGTASACVLEHFTDLVEITNEKKYLDFAEFCVQELEKRPGVEIITRNHLKYDQAQVGEGKMYELLHCYAGIAKLYKLTGKKEYLTIVENVWYEIAKYHQNAAGAPCGGVGIHWECFNNRYMFSPYFRSETCAMMDWLKLNKFLLEISGDVKYAEQIEKIVYNALLGAKFNDGWGWVYHSVMNGQKVLTAQYACCSNSGSISLEEIPPVIYGLRNNGICVNIYTPSKTSVDYKGNKIGIAQTSNYPFDGKIILNINPEKESKFILALRIPSWVGNSEFLLDGKKVTADVSKYYEIKRTWKKGDVIELNFPMTFRTVQAIQEYNHKGEYLDGQTKYISIYKGPLLYSAENWKDTQDSCNAITVSGNFSGSQLTAVAVPQGLQGDAYEVTSKKGNHLLVPYFESANLKYSSYRAIWLKLSE